MGMAMPCPWAWTPSIPAYPFDGVDPHHPARGIQQGAATVTRDELDIGDQLLRADLHHQAGRRALGVVVRVAIGEDRLPGRQPDLRTQGQEGGPVAIELEQGQVLALAHRDHAGPHPGLVREDDLDAGRQGRGSALDVVGKALGMGPPPGVPHQPLQLRHPPRHLGATDLPLGLDLCTRIGAIGLFLFWLICFVL